MPFEPPHECQLESRGESIPRITVVTPSYNQGAFLEETILSVLDQGYPNLEYFIQDGGSTDCSVEIIKRYESRLTGWVSKPDRGQSSAINAGFGKGTGQIYAWLNSDDVYLPGALTAVATCFKNRPDAKVVVGRCKWVDQFRRPIRVKRPNNLSFSHLMTGGGGPGQPAVFFHADVVREVGSLNEDLHLTMDWDYWLRICLRYKPDQIVFLEQDLAEGRVWPGAKSPNAGIKRISERRSILERLYRDASLARKISGYRRIIYSDHHWRTSRCLFQDGRKIAGIINFIRATLLNTDLKILYQRLQKLRTDRRKHSKALTE